MDFITQSEIFQQFWYYIYWPERELVPFLKLPEDQIRITLIFLLTYVLGYIQLKMYNPKLRHAYSLFWGVAIQLYQFQSALKTGIVLMEIIMVFLMMKFLPRKKIGRTVLCFTMLCVFAIHGWRMVYDYGGWKMDISTIIMYLAINLSSIAWSYQDGGMPEEKLSKDQLYRRVVKMPSLFEFLSYAFFYPQAILGPAHEFREYKDFIHRRNEFKQIPSTYLPSLTRLLHALICSGLLITVTKKFPIKYLYSSEYGDSNFLYKLFYIHACMFGVRMKYYAAWCFTDGAAIACGYAFNGFETNKYGRKIAKFDRTYQLGIYEIEFGYNMRTMTENWNHDVYLWLRRYVHLRIMGSKMVSSTASIYITYTFSALWHGFYPVYLCMFMTLALINENGKFIYRMSNKFKIMQSKPIKFLLYIYAMSSANYNGLSFNLLLWIYVYPYFCNMYFFIPVLNIGIFIFFQLFPKYTRGPKIAKKEY